MPALLTSRCQLLIESQSDGERRKGSGDAPEPLWSSLAPSYADTASGAANCVSIFDDALKKSCSDWLKRKNASTR